MWLTDIWINGPKPTKWPNAPTNKLTNQQKGLRVHREVALLIFFHLHYLSIIGLQTNGKWISNFCNTNPILSLKPKLNLQVWNKFWQIFSCVHIARAAAGKNKKTNYSVGWIIYADEWPCICDVRMGKILLVDLV